MGLSWVVVVVGFVFGRIMLESAKVALQKSIRTKRDASLESPHFSVSLLATSVSGEY